MTREEFRNFRSACRKSRRTRQIFHNGRRYSAGLTSCDRLDDSGCYDRLPAARVALALSHAAHARRNLNMPRACWALVKLARELRHESRP